MAKKVAVLVVNPVNGLGLFQYLEAFYENGIPFETFAVADSTDIKTNSEISLKTDSLIADLKSRVDEFDAVVFACGDAIPKFAENALIEYNKDMLAVLEAFGAKGKMLIGHCGAALFFDKTGISNGKKVAQHPYIKLAIENAIATDEKSVVDENTYTAQDESAIWTMMPQLLEALK